MVDVQQSLCRLGEQGHDARRQRAPWRARSLREQQAFIPCGHEFAETLDGAGRKQLDVRGQRARCRQRGPARSQESFGIRRILAVRLRDPCAHLRDVREQRRQGVPLACEAGQAVLDRGQQRQECDQALLERDDDAHLVGSDARLEAQVGSERAQFGEIGRQAPARLLLGCRRRLGGEAASDPAARVSQARRKLRGDGLAQLLRQHDAVNEGCAERSQQDFLGAPDRAVEDRARITRQGQPHQRHGVARQQECVAARASVEQRHVDAQAKPGGNRRDQQLGRARERRDHDERSGHPEHRSGNAVACSRDDRTRCRRERLARDEHRQRRPPGIRKVEGERQEQRDQRGGRGVGGIDDRAECEAGHGADCRSRAPPELASAHECILAISRTIAEVPDLPAWPTNRPLLTRCAAPLRPARATGLESFCVHQAPAFLLIPKCGFASTRLGARGAAL